MEDRTPSPDDKRRARVNAPALALHAWLAIMAVILITVVLIVVFVAD